MILEFHGYPMGGEIFGFRLNTLNTFLEDKCIRT